MKNRAYSLLELKSVDEEARSITGIASTPVTDRAGDIVEPKGAKFDLPIPLLWQHRSDSPIGHVTAAKITDAGIEITAQLAKTDEPGELKNLLDKAWQAIKLQLVRGLSIGFKPLEWSDIAGSWGQRFTSWEWLELSAVTIPANADATIQTVKSLDAEFRAASGQDSGADSRPRARGPVKVIAPKPREGNVKTTQEQIAAFEATRAAKQARMEEIQKKSAEEGRTKNEAEREEFDTLRDELGQIDAELKDLRDMEKLQVAGAKPVGAVKAVEDAGAARARGSQVVVTERSVEKGVRFARLVKTMAMAQRLGRDVEKVVKSMYPDDLLVQKTAVAAGSTTSGNWAEHLTGDETSVFADFVEYLRPMTILGRFGTDGIPALRRVPFRVPLITQTGGGEGYWVGEGKPKPLTAFGFSRTHLEELKAANIAVLTEESIRSSAPSSDTIVRDQLAAALRERLDIDFIDPDKAASAGVSPASITNGITPIPSNGSDAEGVRNDLRALFAAFVSANNPPTSGVFIMSSRRALALGLMRNALGQKEFSDITLRGGMLEGLPVITSEYVPGDDEYGDIVALVNAGDIYLADEGGVQVDVSREASLQMDDAPSTQNALTGTGTSLVSLWQTNSVGFRAERTINWARRRSSAVAVLEDVLWGVESVS